MTKRTGNRIIKLRTQGYTIAGIAREIGATQSEVAGFLYKSKRGLKIEFTPKKNKKRKPRQDSRKPKSKAQQAADGMIIAGHDPAIVRAVFGE